MINRDKAQARTVIAAVSGGVDSVVMLHHLLSTNHHLVVAHFDHGMRKDSAADSRFVSALAEKYRLPFELGEGKLGPKASEETARRARHEFLNRIRQKHHAGKIATAHHHDDVAETAVINLLRGTGRQGMNSLKETDIYSRPLIKWTKSQIYEYALKHRLEWVEDATNLSSKYLRNRVRYRLIPILRQTGKFVGFESLIEWFYKHNSVIDTLAGKLINANVEISRNRLALPVKLLDDELIGKEVLVMILRQQKIEVNRAEVERLIRFANTGQSGKYFNQFPPLKISKYDGWLLFET